MGEAPAGLDCAENAVGESRRPWVDTAEDPPGHLPLPLTDVAGRPRYKNSLDRDAGGILEFGAHERAEVDRTTNF